MNGETLKQNDQTKGSKNTIYDPNYFRIELVVEEDHDKYMDFFKNHFLTREQLCLALHLPPEDFMKYYREKTKTWMYTGASTCAVYTPTNEIAGLMLNQILTRNAPYAFIEEDMSQYSQKVNTLMRILSLLEGSINLFEDPEVNKIMEIGATVVAPKFSGNKIAYRLAEVSEKRAIKLGCQVAMSQSTNIITQHIRAKMGYEVCYTLDYATLENDGKRVLDVSAMNGTTVGKVLKKYLTK